MDDFITSYSLPTTISFPPNQNFINFSASSVQDDITEGTECFYLSLEPIDELVVIPYNNSTVTICIEDDDCEFIYLRFIAC